jgi:dTDP-4-dehydrorhamnose 3,5-epimerase
MSLRLEPTGLHGLVVVHQKTFPDQRGFFQEVYRKDTFSAVGIDFDVQQVNKSGSVANVLRGLHFQYDAPMAKLMRVVRGRAFLVGVDIRKNSPTLGKWFGRVFDAEDRSQLYGDAGFARGFYVLSEYAEIEYLCNATYNPRTEGGIRWNDPEIGLAWPGHVPIVSERDGQSQTLREWLSRPESNCFRI